MILGIIIIVAIAAVGIAWSCCIIAGNDDDNEKKDKSHDTTSN